MSSTLLTGGALAFGLGEHAVRELGGGGGFNAVTRFLPYVGYYLAGYLLTTFTVTERTQRVSRWLVVVGWLGTALGSGALAARYGWTTDGYFLYDYLSPTVMLMSLAVFTAARGWSPKRLSTSRLRRLGGATFGVFLIHPLVLFPLQRYLSLPDSVGDRAHGRLGPPGGLRRCLQRPPSSRWRCHGFPSCVASSPDPGCGSGLREGLIPPAPSKGSVHRTKC